MRAILTKIFCRNRFFRYICANKTKFKAMSILGIFLFLALAASTIKEMTNGKGPK